MSNYKHGLSRTEKYKKEYSKRYREEHKEYFKEHRRKNSYKSNYNITLEDYEQMLEEQNFRCAICRIHISELSRKLYVDHNHETGKVRGLLCKKCNSAIGMFKEDEQIIISALNYLKGGKLI